MRAITHTNNTSSLASCLLPACLPCKEIWLRPRAAWCFMEKQVNCRALSDLGSHLPDRGGGTVNWQGGVETEVFLSGNGLDLLSYLGQRGVTTKEMTELSINLQGMVFTCYLMVSTPISLWLTHRRQSWTAANTYIPDVFFFFVLGVWVRQNAKSIMLFLPHFLFDATSKSLWTALRRLAEEGEKRRW